MKESYIIFEENRHRYKRKDMMHGFLNGGGGETNDKIVTGAEA